MATDYYQISAAPKDVSMATITARSDFLEFVPLFSGLRTFTQTFQHLINTVSRGINSAFAHDGDIPVSNAIKTEHFQHPEDFFFSFLYGHVYQSIQMCFWCHRT